MPFKAKLGIL